MTPLQIELHEARTARFARWKEAAEALMQRQVKRLTDKFDAQDARDAIDAERLAKLHKIYPPPPPPMKKRICREVRHKHGFTWEEMISDNMRLKLCAARFEAWARLRAETSMSLPQIGRLFNRDHTTIMHGIKEWQETQ